MSERHPLNEIRIDIRDCNEIELFALTSLYQERIRHSMEVLEDLEVERLRRDDLL
jgi:hypothetical protein